MKSARVLFFAPSLPFCILSTFTLLATSQKLLRDIGIYDFYDLDINNDLDDNKYFDVDINSDIVGINDYISDNISYNDDMHLNSSKRLISYD
ncbi:Uncharacterized protein BM_BM13447 [Brugia malayi]|uniref:Bm13447 n=1 Tax=Brugia malayi TaxID=6279 RepID=A0A0K0IXV4_BRUMA|nr:Uncharacterized protein BM_BM13447 [Brugia malayi]CDQ03744.1 Bm13447 [Brugia malayi]VIO90441.1 Uncharacterized protein BM_BM13447 [Brugia malayi]